MGFLKRAFMGLCLLLSAVAKAGDRKPADISPEDLILWESVDEPGDPKLPPEKKKIRKKRTKPSVPEPSSRALFANSFTYIRFLHDDRRFGRIALFSSFPTPGDFSFYLATSLTSSSNSRSESDMSVFSYLYYIYTPQFYNFGLAGQFSDSNGGFNQKIRPGLYYKYVYKVDPVAVGLIPAIFPVNDGSTDGRMTLIYSFTFYKRFGLSGHVSYILDEPENIVASTPMAYIEVTKGLRLVGGFDYTSNLTTRKGGWQIGLQFSY